MIVEFLVSIIAICVSFRLVCRRLKKPNYSGKNVWITGASSGIGQALAYEFSQKGANLIISARNDQELQRVKSKCRFPQKVLVVRMDMVEYTQVQRTTKAVIGDLQRNNQKLDVVIQNAGVSMRCLFKDLPFENHKKIMDINLNGPFNHLQNVIKHMINNRQGQIVGVTSLAAKLPTPYRSSYACSKNAFIGLMDSLRTELTPFNISVTNIMPGYIKTNLPFNAMSSQIGKTFNSSDKNIENGMDAGLFARQAVKAIYNRQKQCQISNNWIKMPFVVAMKTILPDLGAFFLRLQMKSQEQAFMNAKQKDI